jgi:hypothetical protein
VPFSSFVEPWATAICRSSGESLLAGAKPADFAFAVGTSLKAGPSIGDAAPATPAARPTAITAMTAARILRRMQFSSPCRYAGGVPTLTSATLRDRSPEMGYAVVSMM